MPGLAKRVHLSASVDGLLLRSGSSSDSKIIRIDYGTNNKITPHAKPTPEKEDEADEKSLETHGIVGLLDLVSSSYLISIVDREQVAQIRGKPVYAVRDVALIPVTSRAEAEGAIAAARNAVKVGVSAEAEETDDSGDEASITGEREREEEKDVRALEEPVKVGPVGKGTSFVRDVVLDKGRYGRFAEKWFSKERRRQGMKSGEEDLTKEQQEQEKQALPEETAATIKGGVEQDAEADDAGKKAEEEGSASGKKAKSVIESLTPRILRSARLYFSSSGFFFSYEHDLSGSLMQRDHLTSSVPLWKRFDELVFWNRHLIGPFIESGHDAFVLPLMQGFVGQRAFSIARTDGTEQDVLAEASVKPAAVVAAQEDPPQAKTNDRKDHEDFLLTLISRRSVKRAGLRYLRRGIDDEGNVANSVETEQILSPQSWNSSAKTFSLVQVRGSIPLFFSQSPHSFKPMPVMFGSESTNQAAFQKHLTTIARRYGSIQIASLVDKHGTEVGIGESYERHAKLLNEHGGANGKPVSFEWFDFHSACKSMNFQNVSILLDTLQSSLESFGWIVKQDDRNIRQQSGVLRTNCMDCLDRTNVVQSAVGGWALQQQLLELGMNIDLQTDPKTQWFNTLWADNGDAISRQYAGTSALKGDFTRTRKRGWGGALFDFSLTLTRYYNNIFSDYFLQTQIDYFLGNTGPTTFDDFEADMMNRDYAVDVQRIRQTAIDTCVKIVLEDPKENLIAGWTLACPHEANALRSAPFEECVLLLTDAALYFCRFEWSTAKVGAYERVDLRDVAEVWRGVYITSILGPTHTDEGRNVGFAVRYATKGRAVVRTNTRSLQNEKAVADENEGKDEVQKQKEPEKDESRLLGFKALPAAKSAVKREYAGGSTTEQQQIQHICSELHRAMTAAVRKSRGIDHLDLDKVPQVEERDVVSLAEARKGTGYIESLGYGLKRMIWS